MKSAILSIAAAATVAAGLLAAPVPAEARCVGCAVGAGVLGGVIIGSAIANSQPRYYAPAPGYVAYDGYSARYPVSCPGGFWARRPVYDRWGNVRGYSRPRFICP
ncbi:MAG: hypothetical protein DVB25_09370 [Verrucomicrobia bacterium]|nr:MAG: hypothetical protein DVB25_09370 [Verrucomicrobiota bacterium]